jgi:lantibiotic modifying enzyme
VLTRASGALDRPDLLPIVERAARWIDRRMATRTQHPPGLYFGSAGAAWALYDAADRLGNGELREHALEYALALPMRWPNPDVCHGSAGAGLTQLHLWQATGDPRFLTRVRDCADGLLAAAVRTGEQIRWPIASDFDSKLAGVMHYGFAHGISGVATFLLAAAAATGREDCLEAAKAAGNTLVAAADRSQEGARWQSAVGGAPTRSELYYYWCSGSSGVGTFLLRLWSATGCHEYRELAKAAALAVRRTRWVATTAACHGLAGNGEFLLDLAEAVGGPYQSWAEEHADCLYARHAIHQGRLVVPDESGLSVVADFNTGLAGVLGFLLRLRRGGPRWWLPRCA